MRAPASLAASVVRVLREERVRSGWGLVWVMVGVAIICQNGSFFMAALQVAGFIDLEMLEHVTLALLQLPN